MRSSLLFVSIDALKDTESSSFCTWVEEHDSEVRINWRFWNAPREADSQLCQKFLKLNVAMVENAGCNMRSSRGRRGSRNIRQGGPDRLPHGDISEFRSY